MMKTLEMVGEEIAWCLREVKERQEVAGEEESRETW